MNGGTRAAYARAGFDRHGVSLEQALCDPLYRQMMRLMERVDARRHQRGQAALAREQHHKGAMPTTGDHS